MDAWIRQNDPNHLITKKLLTYGDLDEDQTAVAATNRSWNGYAFECYLCHRTFASLPSLNQHLRSPAHEENKYHCPKCGKETITLSSLVNHLESGRCGQYRFSLTPITFGGTFGPLRISSSG